MNKINQCDGCQAGKPINKGYHRMGEEGKYPDFVVCTKYVYKEKIIKQWELPFGAKVKLEDGKIVTFKHMDGMYAKWDVDGQLATGNFYGFTKEGDYYVPVTNNTNE